MEVNKRLRFACDGLKKNDEITDDAIISEHFIFIKFLILQRRIQ